MGNGKERSKFEVQRQKKKKQNKTWELNHKSVRILLHVIVWFYWDCLARKEKKNRDLISSSKKFDSTTLFGTVGEQFTGMPE